MSTGKRLAKRSIIGTRVCAPGGDGKFYSGVIQAVKTPANYVENNNSINLTPLTRYTVRFDSRQGTVGKTTAEFRDNQLIGPGFQSVLGVELVAGQKCFVTYNGREVCGEVCKHHAETDEVIISIQPNGIEDSFEVQKRLEEVRLLESRKSARLAYQDTDFARLADMAGDRKRTFSQTIDMPPQSCHSGSRKRQPSTSSFDDNSIDGQMDECNAALVLMSLSCSPLYSYIGALSYTDCSNSSSDSSSNSSSPSHRSTPSPPPLAGSPPSSSLSSFTSDEGIVMDYPPDEQPRKKRNLNRIVFTCTWPSCLKVTDDCVKMEAHLRTEHFKEEMCPPSEQKLYFTKVELGPTSPPPTLSHQDMARPFHEDPDYQRLLVGNMRQTMLNQQQQPQQQPQSQPPPQFQFQPQPQPQLPHKQLKLSPRPQSPKVRPHSPKVRLFTAKTRPISPKTRPISPKTRPISTKTRPHSPKTRPISPKTPNSPRRPRGENKKCRKIYGMEHKEQWCTQCKWKKACSR